MLSGGQMSQQKTNVRSFDSPSLDTGKLLSIESHLEQKKCFYYRREWLIYGIAPMQK